MIEWFNMVGVLAGLTALIVACVNHLNNQKAEIDQRLAEMARRTDQIEKTLIEIKNELSKTSDLLNADLSWRYLYRNDPTRKNLVPRYDPHTRTLEFIDRSRDPARKP